MINQLERVFLLRLPDRFPTKQGLKQIQLYGYNKLCYLPDRFPTKQGLKQEGVEQKDIAKISPRPISNKTRIETAVL